MIVLADQIGHAALIGLLGLSGLRGTFTHPSVRHRPGPSRGGNIFCDSLTTPAQPASAASLRPQNIFPSLRDCCATLEQAVPCATLRASSGEGPENQGQTRKPRRAGAKIMNEAQITLV